MSFIDGHTHLYSTEFDQVRLFCHQLNDNLQFIGPIVNVLNINIPNVLPYELIL